MDSPDITCDAAARSWVSSANVPGTDFPLQNLPFGIVRPAGTTHPWGPAVAIGDRVLDLRGCAAGGLLTLLEAPTRDALSGSTLNALMALGRPAVRALRQTLHGLLREDAAGELRAQVERHLLKASGVEHAPPVAVGDFTDFFASRYHATTVARLRQADAHLPPAYLHSPLAYQGRASSLTVSDTPVVRPWGPRRSRDGATYAPTERLDYEMELGFYVGLASTPGQPVPVDQADAHLFGVSLLNDWSARDVQAYEAQPLGPFLSKSFATTVSPWIVTLDALEPFRTAPGARDADVPPLMAYLRGGDPPYGTWNVVVDATLSSRAMREMDLPPVRLSRTDMATLFWTPAQLVAHQTVNGCALRTGDLLATGTLSGPDAAAAGCLLELTRGGRQPLTLPTGETRQYLEDDDEVTLSASCSAPGAVRIGFGECRGRISAARPPTP